MKKNLKDFSKLSESFMAIFQIYCLIHLTHEIYFYEQKSSGFLTLLLATPIFYIFYFFILSYNKPVNDKKSYFWLNTLLQMVCNVLFLVEGQFYYISTVFVIYLLLFANLFLEPRNVLLIGITYCVFSSILLIFIQDFDLLNVIILSLILGIVGPLITRKYISSERDARIYNLNQDYGFSDNQIARYYKNTFYVFEILTSNVIHDINNSLTMIINAPDMYEDLYQHYNDNKETIIEYNNDFNEKLERVIKRLNLLSKLSHGTLKYENTESINDLIEYIGAVSESKLRKEKFHITVQTNIQKNVIVRFDFRILLYLVAKLLILLRDSLDFTHQDKGFRKQFKIIYNYTENDNIFTIHLSIEGGIMPDYIKDILNKSTSLEEAYKKMSANEDSAIVLALSVMETLEKYPIYYIFNFSEDSTVAVEVRITNEAFNLGFTF